MHPSGLPSGKRLAVSQKKSCRGSMTLASGDARFSLFIRSSALSGPYPESLDDLTDGQDRRSHVVVQHHDILQRGLDTRRE